MNIMDMQSGTKILNKRSGLVYILGDFVNDVARKLKSDSYDGCVDYINKNTEADYEIVDE